MNDFLALFLLALMPGLGNFIGAILAEFGKPSPRLLNLSLHAASGIVIAIVAVELFPESLGKVSGWLISLAFAAGGIMYIGVEWILERFQRGKTSESRTSMWMIYVAVAVDLTSDGIMIGTSSAVSTGLAIILASGQILADLPEGNATLANFRAKGVSRRYRMLLSASLLLYVLVSAFLAYYLLRDAREEIKYTALIFVAGLLTVAAVEEMLNEAHEAKEDSRMAVFSFIIGFALFTFVSSSLEQFVLNY